MTAADANDLTGRELEPAFPASQLPAPHDLVGELRLRLEAVVTEERARRGDVHAPEDIYESVRRIGALSEGLTDYGRAFVTIAKEANGFVEEELVEAVGEQDGVPNSGLRVPDVDGTDLKIELDTRNEYNIDTEIVMTGVAHLVVTTNPAMGSVQDGDEEDATDLVVELLMDAMTSLVACGQFKPQVTKVRAMATEIARTNPKVASTITDMIKRAKRSEFRGVKVKREQPK
jgi:hypothetical protein